MLDHDYRDEKYGNAVCEDSHPLNRAGKEIAVLRERIMQLEERLTYALLPEVAGKSPGTAKPRQERSQLGERLEELCEEIQSAARMIDTLTDRVDM